MALIRCAECGREISDKAVTCPGCGAPPDAYRAASAELSDDSVEPLRQDSAIKVATHSDGRELLFNESSSTFIFGGVELARSDVYVMDRQKRLTWMRLDVRDAMRGSLKAGIPMGDWPLSDRPSAFERVGTLLAQGAGAAAAAVSDGPQNRVMVCPHCHSKGTVATRQSRQKKGISGGKATAAILTGGLSVLATGLSRKESVTRAHCSNCGNTWYI